MALPLLAAGAACSQAAPGPPQRLTLEVIDELPHDSGAFTQGLLWHEGRLYESTGQYGRSTLRSIIPERGEIERQRDLSPQLFGEGLARIDDQLVQLTWMKGRAIIYDLESFEPLGEHAYQGQGWGLCFDGRQLHMTDGSEWIVQRDADTFRETGRIAVTLEDQPVRGINELECAEGWIYANVWQTDWILRIDPQNGRVVALIDAGELRRRVGLPQDGEAVLNGIAYREDTATFFLTGKYWPRLYEVIFVEQPLQPGD